MILYNFPTLLHWLMLWCCMWWWVVMLSDAGVLSLKAIWKPRWTTSVCLNELEKGNLSDSVMIWTGYIQRSSRHPQHQTHICSSTVQHILDHFGVFWAFVDTIISCRGLLTSLTLNCLKNCQFFYASTQHIDYEMKGGFGKISSAACIDLVIKVSWDLV